MERFGARRDDLAEQGQTERDIDESIGPEYLRFFSLLFEASEIALLHVFSRTCLALKGFTETKRRRPTGQQPGTKNDSRPGDKTRMNRLLTDCQPVILFPHSVYIGFRLYMLLERRSGDVSSMPWRVRGTLGLWANSSVGTQSCPTPRGRPAVRLDPTRPWYVRVLDSTGFESTNNRNCVSKERETQTSSQSGLFAVYLRADGWSYCGLVNQNVFVCIRLFYARHVREQPTATKRSRHSRQQPDTKNVFRLAKTERKPDIDRLSNDRIIYVLAYI